MINDYAINPLLQPLFLSQMSQYTFVSVKLISRYVSFLYISIKTLQTHLILSCLSSLDGKGKPVARLESGFLKKNRTSRSTFFFLTD